MATNPKMETDRRTQYESKRPLSIVYISTDRLKLNPANPRIHSEKQLRQIARSIEVFGFNVPVLADKTGLVTAGHGRVQAAKLLGLPELPVIRLEHLSESQVRAFGIADNRLTENADWNNTLLAEQLKMLSEAELDFSVEVTGFQVFQDKIVNPVLMADVMKRADVWMVQRRDRSRFAIKALFGIGVVREMRAQNLDCYGTVKARVAGTIHLAHPAGS